MHLSSSRLTLAATDLGRFLACRHLTGLDVEVALGKRKKPPVYPDPFLDLLINRGLAHEKDYTGKIEKGGSAVLDLTEFGGADAVARTIEAMKAGKPAIAQGALAADGWYGRPDFLQKVAKPSSLGPFSYEAIDTKLTRETRGSTILQLSFYSELLGAAQGVQPEFFHVVTPVASEKYRVSDFAAYYRLVKRRLEEAAASDASALLAANYPEPTDHCDVCRWWQQCDSRRRGDDHLSLVAGITRLNRREFEANGVKTLERLGDLGLPIPFRPAKGSKESLEKAQGQARVQLAGRRARKPIHELLLPPEEGRGLWRLPEPSPGDVFLDLEGDHFAAEGPREYLFGMTICEAPGKTRHVSKWAVGPGDEKPIFEEILDEILGLWMSHPGMHVYHYAPYEPTAFKRLMGRHATRARELDRMLRAELFVDLLSVVKQGLRASVESYSIKKLEEFYGFKRKADLRDAGAARRAVEFGLETGDLAVLTPEIKDLVALYNEEDCVSALRLRDWLESLRPAGPRPPLGDGAASEEAEKRSAEVQDAMDALLKGVPDEKTERTREQHARWLLAHMLEFHRREDKVTWWEFFRLRDLTDEDDLLDERAVVSGLKFEKRTLPKGNRAKAPTDRYSYPSQDFEGRVGDELFTSDGLPLGNIEAIDRAARRIDIKKRLNRIEDHPRWAFAHSHVRADALVASLMRLAADITKNGFAPRSAARDLLLGNPPRLKKGTFGPLKGEDPVDFATRTVLSLDRSLLAIQGPPGAGKTYTGARMIVACVKEGWKVGITAVSHKVIRKLLDEVLEAAREMKVSVSCVQKVKDKSDTPPHRIEEVTDNADVLAALDHGSAQVGAGTAWLWSREEYADAVEVLFVDEAGQASLANVLAMAQAAKSVVLLGDPQQLEQPQRGTHPEGVDASALEHLLAGSKTMPNDRGIFLDKTWRLPPAICAFTSELFYEGRLESRPEQEQQKLSGAPPYEGAGLWFVPVEHDGNTNHSDEEVKAASALSARHAWEGVGPESAFYEQAMDAMDLHTELRGLIESELRDLAAGRVEEAIAGLRRLRRLQPRHLETTARIAQALEKAGRKAEAQWEWEGLGEAFREAGFPEAAEGAREGRVMY
jgi:uncharacterized protein